MFIEKQFKQQEVSKLEYYDRLDIQRSDVMIHIHKTGEECNDDCELWRRSGSAEDNESNQGDNQDAGA